MINIYYIFNQLLYMLEQCNKKTLNQITYIPAIVQWHLVLPHAMVLQYLEELCHLHMKDSTHNKVVHVVEHAHGDGLQVLLQLRSKKRPVLGIVQPQGELPHFKCALVHQGSALGKVLRSIQHTGVRVQHHFPLVVAHVAHQSACCVGGVQV